MNHETRNSSFWVIFDTSTCPDYYKDVHNLLAFPLNAVIRYDYQDVHIAPSAIEAARLSGAQPIRVLLIYAQAKGYRKGDPAPKDLQTFDDMLWVATRFAHLRMVREIKKGTGFRFFFDLQLLEYPNQNSEAIRDILFPLAQAGAVPFQKWVALSDRIQAYQKLADGGIHQNWAPLVDTLGAPPSQFAGDSFWRINRIGRGKARELVRPFYQPEERTESGQTVTIGEKAIYPIHELDDITIEFETHTPRNLPSADSVPRQIKIETKAEGPLKQLAGSAVNIRRFAMESKTIEVSASLRLKPTFVDTLFKTDPSEPPYGSGPDFELTFRVTKKPKRVFWCAIASILSVLLLSGFGGVIEDNLMGRIILAFAGVLSGALAYYLLTGRILLPLLQR
jgi:hypothetical protein